MFYYLKKIYLKKNTRVDETIIFVTIKKLTGSF